MKLEWELLIHVVFLRLRLSGLNCLYPVDVVLGLVLAKICALRLSIGSNVLVENLGHCCLGFLVVGDVFQHQNSVYF